MSTLNEHARANALPSDTATSESYLRMNADIYGNPRHPLHAQIVSEFQALLRQELGPDADQPVNGGVL